MWLFRLLTAPIRITLLTARVMGYNRFVVFVLGIAVGLLVAPTTGAELRDKIRAQIDARTGAQDPNAGFAP
jgi:hypothetical protein